MEISDEIKYKLLLQYFGCKVKHTDMGIVHDWNTITDKTFQRFKEKSFQLVLKPLSAITDEDAIGMAKSLFPDINIWVSNITDGIPIVVALSIDGTIVRLGYNGYIECELGDDSNEYYLCDICILLCYQYLQSKGYDLPQYLLGGKTLHESGLCIYENEN
jgi:hypothetical protein